MNAKPWYQSKTVWIAILQAALGVWAVIEMQDPSLKTVGAAAIIKSALDLLLRGLTTKPLE